MTESRGEDDAIMTLDDEWNIISPSLDDRERKRFREQRLDPSCPGNQSSQAFSFSLTRRLRVFPHKIGR